MNWYVVYRRKPVNGTIQEVLDASGIEYFAPVIIRKKLNDDRSAFEESEESLTNNLIFIRTDENIKKLADATDGLRSPMTDHATGQPAIVPDDEMQRFIMFVKMKNFNARILPDPYQRFKVCQKVRVKAGDFEGTEGYVFRIRGDRKLIISLANMAVAISGIHHTLLEPIEE